jgi:hypothetical protein
LGCVGVFLGHDGVCGIKGNEVTSGAVSNLAVLA